MKTTHLTRCFWCIIMISMSPETPVDSVNFTDIMSNTLQHLWGDDWIKVLTAAEDNLIVKLSISSTKVASPKKTAANNKLRSGTASSFGQQLPDNLRTKTRNINSPKKKDVPWKTNHFLRRNFHLPKHQVSVWYVSFNWELGYRLTLSLEAERSASKQHTADVPRSSRPRRPETFQQLQQQLPQCPPPRPHRQRHRGPGLRHRGPPNRRFDNWKEDEDLLQVADERTQMRDTLNLYCLHSWMIDPFGAKLRIPNFETHPPMTLVYGHWVFRTQLKSLKSSRLSRVQPEVFPKNRPKCSIASTFLTLLDDKSTGSKNSLQNICALTSPPIGVLAAASNQTTWSSHFWLHLRSSNFFPITSMSLRSIPILLLYWWTSHQAEPESQANTTLKASSLSSKWFKSQVRAANAGTHWEYHSSTI